MQKFLLISTLCVFSIMPVFAGTGLFDDIDRQVELENSPPPPPPPFVFDYGYNAVGDYAPTTVGGQQIQYGYNAVGDYVPMSVGGRQINYGYNAEGDYVPMSF